MEKNTPRDANVKSFFEDNVCKRLHCENGVLVGNLLRDDDEDDEAQLFLNVMRWIIAILVIGSIILYGNMRLLFYIDCGRDKYHLAGCSVYGRHPHPLSQKI